MICKIVQNGGFIFMILYTLINVIDSSHFERFQTIQEFCSINRLLSRIEPGEKHQLTLISQSPTTADKWYQKSKRKCYKEFKTDDAASHITLVISNMTIPSCSEICQCNYFEVSISGYSKKYCGEDKKDLYFTSKSDVLSIAFHHDKSMLFNVTLTFIVERNAYITTGEPGDSYFIETPYFPLAHPANYKAEYVLRSNDVTGHVVLLFLDFLISKDSFIEIVGHNGSHPVRFYGDSFRPPLIISQFNRLEFRFEANNQRDQHGFRALCSFVKSNISQIQNVITDCGGVESGRGGAIVLKSNNKSGFYDCIWHVIPSFLQYKTFYLSLSVSSLNLGPKAFLEFREGLFSNAGLIKRINCTNCGQVSEEVTVLASNGLYIRFSGHVDADSPLSMIYSTYHTGNCSDIEKLCLNERCLHPDLQCDGVNHCSDGSDEQFCSSTEEIPSYKSSTNSSVKRVRLHHSSVEATFIVILTFGSCGIIGTILVIFFMGFRFLKNSPATVDHIPPSQVINEAADDQLRLFTRSTSDYDSPPSYDDFMKSGNRYPPLLFTRAKRLSEPYNSYSRAQRTTSFCKSERPRHHSEHAFVDLGESNCNSDIFHNGTDVSDMSFASEPGCSFHQSNMEWTIENAILKPNRRGIKRSSSLDSKLNEVLNQSTCHFLLSIIHPKCPHMSSQCPQVHCHTLPANFKVKDCVSNGRNINYKFSSKCATQSDEIKHSEFFKSRNLSWSYTPHVTSSTAEVLTMVKTRCNSDPCKVIVHYSLYP